MDESERQSLRVPAWCPICDMTMRDDPKVYNKWGCCQLCFIEFIEHSEERWQGGWRPSTDVVDRFIKKIHG
jgi:hypothetical protein